MSIPVTGLRPKKLKSAASTPSRGQFFQALPYLTPGTLGLVIFILGPLVASLFISFTVWPMGGSPEFVGLQNYARMIQDPVFWRVMFNTTLFAILYTAINLAFALGMATWLNRSVRFAGFFRVLFFLPVITPGVANALIWQLMLNPDGVVNATLERIGLAPVGWLTNPVTAMGAIIVMTLWQAFGYNLIILSAGLKAIPDSVYEAAAIDGASPVQRFFKITLPMVSPALFFCMIMTVIGSFKIFVQPYLLTLGGPGESTNMLVLYLYRNAFTYDRMGYASALAWALFVLVMLVTALQFSQQKRFVNYDV